MATTKKILRGLNHKDYEHDFDRKALDALEKTPGVEKVSKYIVKNTIERIYTVQYTGSNLKITRNNYPAIYNKLEEACKILDVKDIPEFYLQWGYNINGFTTGAEKPLIVLNSGVIDLCDDDELLFIIGHEVGHIKSSHMLYHMMAQGYSIIASMIDSVTLGLGGLLTTPIQLALFYWYRMSEFTADRAGVLCCQSGNAAIRAMMKMSGMPIKHFNDMNFSTFVDQAREFQQLDYNGLNKLVKTISVMDQTHPWTVMRSAQLLKWLNSGECTNLMNRL
jgi:Zn-dependent protease with chaperone function